MTLNVLNERETSYIPPCSYILGLHCFAVMLPLELSPRISGQQVLMLTNVTIKRQGLPNFQKPVVESFGELIQHPNVVFGQLTAIALLLITGHSYHLFPCTS